MNRVLREVVYALAFSLTVGSGACGVVVLGLTASDLDAGFLMIVLTFTAAGLIPGVLLMRWMNRTTRGDKAGRDH